LINVLVPLLPEVDINIAIGLLDLNLYLKVIFPFTNGIFAPVVRKDPDHVKLKKMINFIRP
jgi:hypothetical protein